jgi:two-component system, LytTR family, sensor kinase
MRVNCRRKGEVPFLRLNIMSELPGPSPSWNIGRQCALVVSVWAVFLILLSVNNYIDTELAGYKPRLWDVAGFPVASFGLWILFTPAILIFIRFARKSISSRVLWASAHLLCAATVMVADAIGWMLVPSSIRQDLASIPRPSWKFIEINFLQGLQWNLWMYWTVVGIVYGLQYYLDMRDARLYAAELESELAQVQLQTLKQQLRPHFLFNTLNAISGFIHTNPRAADDMIGNLSSLLRLSLDSGEVQNVLLKDELRALQLYIDIQQARFGKRFTVEMRINPQTLGAYVPHLMLQPLVENAFHHGISKRKADGLLRIESERRDGMVHLLVADNGPGSGGQAGHSTGIGLKNSRARLRRLYGELAALNIADSAIGFTVEAVFPFVGEAEELH